MTKVLLPLATVATLAVTTLAPSASFATEPGAAYGGTVDALTSETRGLATSADQVRSQGGFATAGAVQWTRTPAAATKIKATAF